MVPLVTEFALEARPFGADAPPDRAADVKATFDIGGKAGVGWNINGNRQADGVLIKVKLGQRVEVLLRNQTASSQSLHLHGHSFQVRGTQGQKFAGPMRDTLLVPPQSRVLISFDADNPGIWPLASTHVYRRLAGLRGMIAYEGI
jgi:FtsP/CotA-like multicopper oxidase with cupredoxin domain